MTARCGSFDANHRAKTCKTCQRIYRERERSGKPKFGSRFLARGRPCVFCGISLGNSAGTKVYSYTLRRSVNIDGLRTSRALGMIPICDGCIVEYGLANAQYRSVLKVSRTHDGIRAYDGMPTAVGM